jgi:hypothetical protein
MLLAERSSSAAGAAFRGGRRGQATPESPWPALARPWPRNRLGPSCATTTWRWSGAGGGPNGEDVAHHGLQVVHRPAG